MSSISATRNSRSRSAGRSVEPATPRPPLRAAYLGARVAVATDLRPDKRDELDKRVGVA